MGICFCHFNGYEVKDAAARKSVEDLRKQVENQCGTHERDGCYSRIYDGSIEFINPPMIPGNEYRTTERYNGLPVYTKLIEWNDHADFSGDPFVEIVSHPFTSTVISIDGVVLDSGGEWKSAFPFYAFADRALIYTVDDIASEQGKTEIKFLDNYEHEDERKFIIKLKYVKP